MDQRTLLRSIAEGFHKTPEEALMSILIIIGVIVIMILVPILYHYSVKNKSRKNWIEDYNIQIRKLDLTINELDLLNAMAVYLVNPMRKILLIKNRNTFHNALSLWEKQTGQKSVFAQTLKKKLFPEEGSINSTNFEKTHGIECPARYISSKGQVYSGIIISRKDDVIILGDVKKKKEQEKEGKSRLFIQDYKGFVTLNIGEVKELENDSLQLHLLKNNMSEKKQESLSSIYVYIPGEATPVQSRLSLYPNGVGIIENPGGILKSGQAVKVALRTEINKIYRVNAMVISVSLNKRYAKMRFGYVKSS